MFVDAHCHLHDASAFPDPVEELRLARAAGVERVVVVGTRPDDWAVARSFAEGHESVDWMGGWHPNTTGEHLGGPFYPDGLPSPILGEVGLDRYHTFAPWDRQLAALREGLRLAHGRKVVFHAREAVTDVLDEVESARAEGIAFAGLYFHCFAGSREEARRAMDLDVPVIFGVNGPVTYPKAEELRSVLREIGLDRLVLETDAPYLSPVPHRGKPNRPAYVPRIAEGLARALGVPLEEVAARTTATATEFFG